MKKTENAVSLTLTRLNALASQPAVLVLVVWFVLKF